MALLDILLDRSGAIGGRIRSDRLKAGRDSSLQKRPPSPTRTTIITEDGKRLVFDAATNIDHVFPSEITSYPVEDKSTVTDHIINKNPTFSVNGVFSDASKNIPSIPNNYSQAELEVLFMKIRDDRKPVSLLTPIKTYTDLLVKNISFPRSAGQGTALYVSIEFEKVRRVSNELTTVFVGSSSTSANGDSVKNTTGDIKNNGAANKDANNKESTLRSILTTAADGSVSSSGNNLTSGGEVAQ